MHIRLLVSAYLFITGFVQFESVCRRGCPSPSKMAHVDQLLQQHCALPLPIVRV